MKTSSPESPKPIEAKSILLLGPPGSGKTTLSMQFPYPCFMDCDRNMDGPERFLRKHNKTLLYAYEQITYDEEGKAVPVERCYDRLMEKLTLVKEDKEVRTVIIDGLTMVNEFVIQKILKDKGVKEMEARHWQPFKSLFISLLVAKLRGMNKTTICTCHEIILEKPDPKQVMQAQVIGYRPSVQGGITDYFGGFFTDVWRCTSEAAAAGKSEYKITTVRNAQSDLKNSLGLPSEIIIKEDELVWPKLEPYMKGLV